MLVNIRVSETVIYDQEVEMTEEEYNKLRNHDGTDIRSHESVYHDIEDFVDRRDVMCSMDEWLDFSIDKVEE